MLLAVCVALSLIVFAESQTTGCPGEEEMLICKKHVKDLADTVAVPTHSIFESKTFFIKPLEWGRWETDQVCAVKDDYIKFLQCSVNLLQRCVLENRRDPFMSIWRIQRAINFLCDNYRCDDCSRKWCWKCDTDRYFDYDCTKQKYPELSTCMKPYEYKIYTPTTTDVNRQREDYNDYQCRLIEHHRSCTRQAYKSCGYYTSNVTDWYSDYARPAVCSATSVAMSAILISFTTILVFLH